MKSSTLFFSFLLTIAFISCGKDDAPEEPSCEQSTWIGTYTVDSTTCDEDSSTSEIPEGATITITAGASENEIMLDFGDGEGPSTLMINGCSLTGGSGEVEIFGIIFDISFDGDLNGNTFSMNINTKITSDGTTSMVDCSVMASK